MKVPHIIGADLSKDTIDFATPQSAHIKVTNDQPGYQTFMQWLKQQSINTSKMMMVMEHTGPYSYQFEQFLHAHHLAFTKVSALAIKRSMGLVRGKNDKIDAIRIARYGYEKRDKLVNTAPMNKAMERLLMLHSMRRRLVKQRTALLNALKVYKDQYRLTESDPIVQCHRRLIRKLSQEIEKIEVQEQKVFNADSVLKRNRQLLQSCIGVGDVISVATIIKTRNFTRFTDARKFACHCGTAPFEHTSGKTIRGKTRVNHMADKEMKTLLEQGARSAIQYDKELREFYLKRIEAGKSPTSTRNIVRNKLIYRMFAVIKRQTPFIKHDLRTTEQKILASQES